MTLRAHSAASSNRTGVRERPPSALRVRLARISVGTHHVGDVVEGVATAVVAAMAVKPIFVPDDRLARRSTAIF